MAGRPPSLESREIELLCELQALTQEGIQNELDRLRVMRQLAQIRTGRHQQTRSAAVPS